MIRCQRDKNWPWPSSPRLCQLSMLSKQLNSRMFKITESNMIWLWSTCLRLDNSDHISLQKLLKNVWQAIQLCDMCMLLTNLPPKCWIPKTCWAIDQQDCDSKEIPQSGLLLQKRLRQRSKTSFGKIQATACHRSHCVSQPEQHSTRWSREVVCICICKYLYLNFSTFWIYMMVIFFGNQARYSDDVIG